ncbi:endonuclease/exonuclease/phosphatase [Chondrocystis sp. NIES-4102]|nr:endonuclease/exonuclease/phosphatase [Chondrocystis sp. NIES-4102]
MSSNNLNTELPETLFVPLLGQSNATHMSVVYDYQPDKPIPTGEDTSGAIVLQQKLTALTGSNIVTSDNMSSNFAIGGSKVNGNGYFIDDNFVWWYPDFSQPGGALYKAEAGLNQWLSQQGAQPTDEIAIVWSQGESDVADVSDGDPIAREKYKQSTNAVFDYLKSKLNYADVKFYITPTGRLQNQAAANIGLTQQEINSTNNGTAIIREVQAEIATERDDVQLMTDYSDLNMIYEEAEFYGDTYDQDESEWSTDIWHLGHDGLKIHGDRVAQYIALDRGDTNLISFYDSFGNPALTTSLSRDGLLDLNISADPVLNPIQGTDVPDVIVGTLTPDTIIGGAGNDVIIASQGVDTLTGGLGDDVFFYDSLVYPEVAAHYERILDFELGRDRLDVSEPLKLAGYTGTTPVEEGYIVVNPLPNNSLELKFDADGIVGASSANTLTILENVDPVAFQNQVYSQLIITPTEF